MNRQTIAERTTSYTVSLDDSPAAGQRLWAIVQGRLVDELTGMPVLTGAQVLPAGTAFDTPAARAAVNGRTSGGGIVGLIGIPAVVFPRLSTQGYEVGIDVRADGYVPVRHTHAMGAQAAFPTEFAPADVGDLELHRRPVILRGRTLRKIATGELVALPNATVRVTGIWRTIPTANAVVPPLAPHIAAVLPPLYTARATATGHVHAVSVTQTAGEDKTTLLATAPGDTTLRLSDHVNLVPNDVIVLDDTDPERREVIVVVSIAGPSSQTQAVTVTLATPLAVAHARGTIVRTATIAPAGPTDAIGTDAVAGDTTLLLASAMTLASSGFVSIDDGISAAEYHWCAPYVVTSDADGFYRLPPLGRVAQITLEAQQASYTPVPQTISLNYAVREQFVDLVVT